MTTLRMPHPSPRMSALAALVREAFWVIALGVIACYVFFVALGAFKPGEVLGLSIAVAILLVLWLVHAWAQGHRHHDDARDPRLSAARERRGF